MFNFPRHLPELIAYGTGITAALRGKAGGRAGAQRRQIENDVKKNPAFFCFAVFLKIECIVPQIGQYNLVSIVFCFLINKSTSFFLFYTFIIPKNKRKIKF